MAFFVAATTTNKIENYTTPGDVTPSARAEREAETQPAAVDYTSGMPRTREPACEVCGRPMNDWADLRTMYRSVGGASMAPVLRICFLGSCPDVARRRGYE